MKTIYTSIIILFSTFSIAQDLSILPITSLDGEFFENSGLIYIEDRLITHNDSGDGPYLYEIDQIDGERIRKVTVANAGSQDWEDITNDDTYIYIGDIGNNSGTRTNLRIYRITIEDYLTTANDTVYCDTISFNYSDQIDFTSATYSTNYDAEALIAYNDSLYIFTKNWGNSKTNIYSVPKEIGTYSVSKIDSIDVEGLITGATYDSNKNEILLCGYTLTTPFVYFIKDFTENNFSDASIQIRSTPTFEGSIQIEGVAALGNHTYYISSENGTGGTSYLHELKYYNFAATTSLENEMIRFYPNPVVDFIRIEIENTMRVEILNLNGQIVHSSIGMDKIDLNNIAKGVYILHVFNQDDNLVYKDKLIKI